MSESMMGIVIAGSTGTIGRQALDVVERLKGRFKVVGLAAGRRVEELAGQVERFRPDYVCVADHEAAARLERLVDRPVKLLHGREGLMEIAGVPEASTVLVSVSGFAGLWPTMAAVRAGKRVAVASKEALVVAGEVLGKEALAAGCTVIPVDSEHSAVFQCLCGATVSGVTGSGAVRGGLCGTPMPRRIMLTASGGPFISWPKDRLEGVTPQQALAHPNWTMGSKITVDSATMMNKGLEVIEAHVLFGVDYHRIDVVVHRESIVHSLVEMEDGSVLAQLGWPDMRLPIQYALTYPERVPGCLPPLDLARVASLTFEPPDLERFPCLGLGYEAGKAGGTVPAVLSAADEVAVEGFLAGKLRFTDIYSVISSVIEAHDPVSEPGLDDIISADQWARRKAAEVVAVLARKDGR